MIELYLDPNDTPESQKTIHLARIVVMPSFLNPNLKPAEDITLYTPEKGEFHTHRWSRLLETAQLGDFVEYKEWVENSQQDVKKNGDYYRYFSRGGQHFIDPLSKEHKYIVRQVIRNLSAEERIKNLKEKYNEELARLKSTQRTSKEK